MTPFISLLGVISHYYDYHIIGFLVIKLSNFFFLSADNSNLGLIKTFIVLYLSIILKPLGAVIFGRIGDIQGRQMVLKNSLLISGILAIITSIIPVHENIRSISVIILLFCRTGIAAVTSSGTDSMRLYMYERLKKFPILGNGIVGGTSIIGSGIASFSALIFTNPNLPDYFWRFSIALGGIFSLAIALIFFLFKDKLDQNNYLKSEKTYEIDAKKTLIEIIKTNLTAFCMITILIGSFGALYNFNTIFWTAISATNFGNQEIIQYIPYGILIYFSSILIFCYLADIFGPLYIVFGSIIASIFLYIQLIYYISDLESHIKIYYCLMFTAGGIVNPGIGIIAKSISITIRQRIFSFAHSIGSIFISHTTAIICTGLCNYFNSITFAIYYIIFILLMILICTFFLSFSKEKG